MPPNTFALCVGNRSLWLLASQTRLQWNAYDISLLRNATQLINGHFVEDSFLTIRGDEQSLSEALNCLDVVFAKPLGLASNGENVPSTGSLPCLHLLG